MTDDLIHVKSIALQNIGARYPWKYIILHHGLNIFSADLWLEIEIVSTLLRNKKKLYTRQWFFFYRKFGFMAK